MKQVTLQGEFTTIFIEEQSSVTMKSIICKIPRSVMSFFKPHFLLTSHHFHTQNSQAKAFLEIQLGAPAAPRPGAQDVRSNVSVEARFIENTEVEAKSVKTIKYTCELCEYTSQTEHCLNVHMGHKHKDVQKTPVRTNIEA